MTSVKKIKVLLVDDCKHILELFGIFLDEQTNIKVIGKASDGKQAIALCCQLQPDVVLMDIRMPVLNGIEATKVISSRHPSIQVIAHSSLYSKATMGKISEAGACGFLQKGCSLDEVIKAIEVAA